MSVLILIAVLAALAANGSPREGLIFISGMAVLHLARKAVESFLWLVNKEEEKQTKKEEPPSE